MSKIDKIIHSVDIYCDLVKQSFIRKLPNGEYRVLSEKSRNLGSYKTKDEAKKRLQQVEYFKHKDENKAIDTIDLSNLDDLSLSAIMRELRKKGKDNHPIEFLKLYKQQFDKAIRSKLQKPDKVALQKTLVKFNKKYKIKINKDLVKNAAVAELGDSAQVGQYLANIIKFTLNRIPADKRPKAINSMRHKIYNLNANELSNKEMPSSAAMGQSITFVKHVLFNHDAKYIREVLNHIIRNL